MGKKDNEKPLVSDFVRQSISISGNMEAGTGRTAFGHPKRRNGVPVGRQNHIPNLRARKKKPEAPKEP